LDLYFCLDNGVHLKLTVEDSEQPYKLARRYLLNDLPSEEREKVEASILADQAFYEEVCELENDLFWEYAAGKLSVTERQAFETAFLMSEDGRRKAREIQEIFGELRESVEENHSIPAKVT